MTTRLAQPGEIGYDAAGFVSTQCVINAGEVGDWLSLYLVGRYRTGRSQWEALWRLGKGGMPNWELDASYALNGYAAGVAAAKSAAQAAAALRMPLDQVPIPFSLVDFGPTTAQYSVMDDTFHGLVTQSIVEGVWPGYYGETTYGDHLTALDFWLPEYVNWQWAGGPKAPRAWAHAKQKYGSYTRDVSRIGCSVDENVTVQPLRLWTGDGPDEPKEKDLMSDTQYNTLMTRLAEVEQSVANNATAVAQRAEQAVQAAMSQIDQVVADNATAVADRVLGWLEAHPSGGVLAPHTHDGGPTGPAKPA